jgi:hypothetical protein
LKNFFRHFIPRYDELTLFVMSLTCCLIFLVNVDVLKDATFSFSKDDLKASIPFAIFFAGLGLSIYRIFVRRIKTSLEKLLMLFFAVFLNAAGAIAAGTYVLEHSQGYAAFFPTLNIINGAWLLLLLRGRVIDENSIIETNVGFRFVCIASGIAILLFLVCQYMLKLYWASTFSICVAHATNLNDPIIRWFIRDLGQARNTA